MSAIRSSDIGLTSPLERVMSRDVVSVLPDTSVARACVLMADAHVGCTLVVAPSGSLAGIFNPLRMTPAG